jgi:pimeloyl-ACP methyl ester carboxylesterase
MNRFENSRDFSRANQRAADPARLGELALEFMRPAAETAALLRDPVYWGWGVRHGDGHHVLVLPGLGGGDTYLRLLRGWLKRIGYAPLRSGLDRNPGWSEELVRELGEIAERAFTASGRRVTIVGHSMGGVQGRSIAVRHPDRIDHVITLGSPLALSRSRVPEGVRLTAIYSREDRIVPYPRALAEDGRTRNIEVHGSHIGLASNAEVYRQLASLL